MISKKDSIKQNEIDDDFDITDLYKLVSIVIKNYFIVIFVTIIIIISTIIYLKFTNYKYSISLSVIPTPINNVHTSNIGEDNPFASIVGVSIPSINKGKDQFILYQQLIPSITVSEQISKDKDFMIKFYSGNWDSSKNEWIENKVVFSQKIKNFIKSILGLPIYDQQQPNAYSLHEYVKEKVQIFSNKKTGITSITLLSSDPLKGKILLNKLHQTADFILKKRSMMRSEDHIKFLNKQLSKTVQIDQKNSLILALAEEQKKLMMASSSLPYIAEPFDGNARSSILPTQPHPSKLLLQNTFLGIVLGVIIPILIAFFKDFFKKLKSY